MVAVPSSAAKNKLKNAWNSLSKYNIIYLQSKFHFEIFDTQNKNASIYCGPEQNF